MDRLFNLQLFTEDNGGTSDNAPATNTAADSGGDPELSMGADGSVKLKFYDNFTPGQDDDDKEPPQAPPDKGQGQPDKETLTPDQIKATDFEKLDPAKIPPELVPFYKSMQAGFTRKTQELAEAMKVIKDLPEQIRQREPEAPRISPKDFYAQQHTYLRAAVAKDFGIDPARLPENTADWLQEMRDAYEDKRMEIRQRANAEEQAKQTEEDKRASFKATADALTVELQAMDPEAYADFEAKLKGEEFSQKEVKTLAAAIIANDKKTVLDIFEKHRTAYHAEKNGIQTGQRPKPTKLEPTGNGGQQETKRIDYTELGKLQNWEDKMAWLRKHNIKP